MSWLWTLQGFFFSSFSFGRGEYFIEMIYYLSLITRINIWHQAGTLAGHIPQARQRSLLYGTYTSIIEMLFLLHLHVGVMLSPRNAYLEHLPTPPPLLWPFTKNGVLKHKYSIWKDWLLFRVRNLISIKYSLFEELIKYMHAEFISINK